MSPLDNAAWSALTGTQASLATRQGAAARFPTDVSPFSAIADPGDPDAWADLARLMAPSREAVLTWSTAVAAETDWTRSWSADGVQLLAAGDIRAIHPDAGTEVVELGEADAGAMAALVGATRPGPWEARTWTLGPYLGVRDGDRLVAMAGTRLHLHPWREISAVCTAPEHRGRGLAAALVTRLAEIIRAAGGVPFLQAAATNTGAVRLYRSMGFDTVRPVTFALWQAPASDPPMADGTQPLRP